MNYQVKQSDCKFYVNEKERTIACVIDHLDDIPIKELMHTFYVETITKHDKPPISFFHNKNWYDMCVLKNSYSGVAKCSPEDEWNEETGKLIAFSRAKNALYVDFFQHANTIIQKIDSIFTSQIEDFNRFGEALGNSKASLKRRIDMATGVIKPDEDEEEAGEE